MLSKISSVKCWPFCLSHNVLMTFSHMSFSGVCRGVFQTLVEKHFPAPDRKKTGFLFGLSSMFDSPAPSPKAAVGSKRKRDAGEL